MECVHCYVHLADFQIMNKWFLSQFSLDNSYLECAVYHILKAIAIHYFEIDDKKKEFKDICYF